MYSAHRFNCEHPATTLWLCQKSRLLRLLSVLTAVLIAVSACAPAAPPPVAPAAPSAPAPVAPPAAAPPAVAPARPAPAPTAVATAPAPAVPAAKPPEEKPQTGGILKVPVTGETRTVDSHQERSSLQVPAGPAETGLLQFSPEEPGKIIPDLAERWDISQDGKTYTFHLRLGVKWHDGTPLTAEDVKFSIDRQSRPQKGLTIERLNSWSILDRTEIVDGKTVRLILKEPGASFLMLIAERHAVIKPKHFFDAGGNAENTIVGTGPFKLTRYQRGIRYDLVKNPDYYIPGRPYLDGITFFIIKDSATIMAAFKTGGLHLTALGAGALTPAEVEILKKDMPQAALVPSAAYNGPGYWVNWNRKPWTDVRVRRAVHLALDRQEAINILEKGFAEIAGFFPPSVDGAISKEELLKMPGYRQPKNQDIAEAKKLLAEAGFPNGFPVELMQRNDDASREWAQLVINQLSKVGIKGQLKLVTKIVSDQLRATEDFDSYAIQVTGLMPDPDDYSRFYTGKSTGNYSRNADPKLTAMFDAQRTELNPTRRTQMVRDLELYMQEIALGAPLYWAPFNMARWPQVRGYNYMNYNMNVRFQNVWLAQ